MTYFPQINGNLILTQLPYQSSQEYDSVAQDLDTGMRWTFPRRAAGLDGYPTVPLLKFNLNFPTITDAEVTTLAAFHDSMRGQWGEFRFLDPGGNLLQYSEDLSQSYWDKSSGSVVPTSGAADPFGHTLGTGLSGGGGSAIKGLVGASDGGMSGFVVCASVWIKGGASVTLGFDFGTSTTWQTSSTSFRRIFHSSVVTTNSAFHMTLSWDGSAITVFGLQVSPMKGEGAYVKSPDNYGYHQRCRFGTDSFVRQINGPNENSVQLPVVEYFVAP